tara:strand:+ start:138 stop:731 length:594 start_codon:yes stop_codon:yes gene_type:complete
VLNLKPQVLDYVLKIDGVIKPPLINLINEQIYNKEAETFQSGGVGGKDEAIYNTEIRSVQIQALYEDMIGTSISKRVIYNELKMATSQIENIYREKVCNFYHSSSNYFQFLYYNSQMKGHYEYHTDYVEKFPRHLTIIVGLNDKKEYEGGKLFIQNHEEGITLDKGEIVCFPSNFMFPHKVSKVTKGERKVMIIWTR